MSEGEGGVGPIPESASEAWAGRLFLALTPPKACRDAIARSVESAFGGRALPGRRVPPERWHLTLKFLGDTEGEAVLALCGALDEADLGAAFRLEFAGLGAFPSPRRAKVLWMGCDEGGAELARLAKKVDAAAQLAGFEAEGRPFRAHLTLSRLRPPQDLRGLLEARSGGRATGSKAGAVVGSSAGSLLGSDAATGSEAGPEAAGEAGGAEGPVMWADSLRLYRSHLGRGGPRYEVLRSWPLTTS